MLAAFDRAPHVVEDGLAKLPACDLQKPVHAATARQHDVKGGAHIVGADIVWFIGQVIRQIGAAPAEARLAQQLANAGGGALIAFASGLLQGPLQALQLALRQRPRLAAKAPGRSKVQVQRPLRPALQGGLGEAQCQIGLRLPVQCLADLQILTVGQLQRGGGVAQRAAQGQQRSVGGSVTHRQAVQGLGQAHQLRRAGAGLEIHRSAPQQVRRRVVGVLAFEQQVESAEQRGAPLGQRFPQQQIASPARRAGQAAQQFDLAALGGAAQPVCRLVQLAQRGGQVGGFDQLAGVRQVGLADQRAHLGVDRVERQHLLGQTGRLFEGTGVQRDLDRLLHQLHVAGQGLLGPFEPDAGLLQVALGARVVQQAQVGVAVRRVEGQALLQPVQGMATELAVLPVSFVRVGQPAQHQRAALAPDRRCGLQIDETQPVLLGPVGLVLQIFCQRQHSGFFGRRQRRGEAGIESVQPLRHMRQQAQAQRSGERPSQRRCRRAVQRHPVAHDPVKHIDGGDGLVVTQARHQIQHQRPLRRRAAFEVEHQPAAGVVELGQGGQPADAWQQSNPESLGQRLERPARSHPGQRGLGQIGCAGLQCQGFEQRPQIAVGGFERDRLQRGVQGRRIARHTGRHGSLGGGPVQQQRAVRRQASQLRVWRHQGRRCQLGQGRRLVVSGQLGHPRHQAQRLRGLAALQQPAHIGPAQQRHLAGFSAGAPQRNGLFEHALGRQLLGPAGIGRRQTGQPGGAPLAFEQALELLDGVLAAPRRQG